MDATWKAGSEPYVRTASAGRPFTCYFCGSQSADVSRDNDVASDTGRVGIRCSNPECDVREVAVIVLHDKAGAGGRADVLALEAIDRDPSGGTSDPTSRRIGDGQR